eukprot:3423573-Pleurochrysis_carterae.AAC.1
MTSSLKCMPLLPYLLPQVPLYLPAFSGLYSFYCHQRTHIAISVGSADGIATFCAPQDCDAADLFAVEFFVVVMAADIFTVAAAVKCKTTQRLHSEPPDESMLRFRK